MRFKTTYRAMVALMLLAVALTGVALAQDYTLEGGATLIRPGFKSDHAVELRSDALQVGASIAFEPADRLTFADLTVLRADYNVTDDGCLNGSPRFSIGLNTSAGLRYVFAYLGPTPQYQGCTPNLWLDSRDLLESGIAIDTSQLGGTFYDSYENAMARYGGLSVASIDLIVDDGAAFADGEQTIWVDDVRINDTVFDFEPDDDRDDNGDDSSGRGNNGETQGFSRDDCRRGGWRDFTGENGLPGPFRNQGQCTRFFVSNGQGRGDDSSGRGRGNDGSGRGRGDDSSGSGSR